MLTFEQPLLLLLLLPIGILIYFTWKRMALPFPMLQRRLILLCRITLFVLVIAALAGAAWSQPVSRQTTIFVGDISASTSTQRAFIEHWINNALSHKRHDDQVGIVAVGRNALVEQAVSTQIDFSRFESTPDTNYTDLAAGLRLAAAIMPANTTRHIILLSDGQQNLEDALQEAQLLQQQGIRLDIVPLPTSNGPEARIDNVSAPTELRTNERFVLHTQLFSTVAQQAILHIYLDHTLLGQVTVNMVAGTQQVSFDLPSPPPGFHTYHLTLDAPQDTILQNNEASAFVNVQGPPQVLVIEGFPGSGVNIVSALKATGMNVTVGTPNDVPTELSGLAAYSSIVLADVPAIALGTTRMQVLQSFVRDLGRGLVVSGGQNSYGVGGYANTPLEQTLPVSMDIPQHKDTPSIAVVLIIESLESDSAVNISKEAAKGVINLLTPNDQVGISAAYGTLEIPMQHVTNKTSIDKAIDAMNPTDPPSYLPDLINAENVLLHTDAKIKHVILLGDGDAFDNYATQVLKMAKENITVSTVATNSGSYAELGTMQQIASWGKGRFYRADNPAAVPAVLLKETQQAARRAIINETFLPAIVGNHPILTGLGPLPTLNGYVATTPKPAGQLVLVSSKDDPVLAVWQYGLGHVAAWTSDALGLWTANWLQWSDAARWWANLVTWTLPTPDSALTINGSVVGGTGHLTVDLPAETISNANGQQMQVHIIAPDLSQETVTLQPDAPGRWVGNFPALQVGAYLLQVTWRATTPGNANNPNQLSATSGLVVPYSPEFQTQGTDIRFLKQLANAGKGTLLNPSDPTAAFIQQLPPVSTTVPISFWLLILAALLLPVDVGLRRLAGLEFIRIGYQKLISGNLLKHQESARVTPAETPIEAQLGMLRMRREERRSRAVPTSTPPITTTALPVSSLTSARKSSPSSTTESQPTVERSKPANNEQNVSTTQQLLAAKRKRTQQHKSDQGE